jgi:nucleoside-diphosphate-sugar epimerase
MFAAKTNSFAGDSNNNYNVYNIGTGKPIKIKDLAKVMIKIFRLDVEPIF